MSAESNSIELEINKTASPADVKIAERAWKSFEDLLERIGDRLNPILVKETRQALKSRQFLITFALLLILGWGWSILGIATIGPGASAGSHGGEMFLGYFIILAFPLMVVVPFGTFRSLAAEQESRTYELLSITALGPRQIVAGKLGSAILQMSVYLSAVSPCIGFTYLLRGIDFLTIILILFWITLASLGASAIGLLMATSSPRKQFQAIPMVGQVIGFFWIFGLLIAAAVNFIEQGGSSLFSESWFWIVNAAILTAFAAYFVMICEASASRLSFASDNHSTRLRMIMVLHYLLFTGWIVVVWMLVPEQSRRYALEFFVLAFMIAAGIHWYVMGMIMIGEMPTLSERVKRQLPQSFLGRMFLTWFYPGPGTGYALAICGLICTLLTAGIGMIVGQSAGPGPVRGTRMMNFEVLLTFGVLGLSYVTFYLGLGLLLIRALRRVTSVGIMLSILLQVLLLLIGCLVPLVIHLTSPELRYGTYSLLHTSNPFWTLMEICNRTSLPQQAPFLVIFVPLAAAVVFMLNLPSLIGEIRNIRIAKPQRVAEDDAELTPSSVGMPEDNLDYTTTS